MNAVVKLYQNDGAGKKGWPVKIVVSHKGNQHRKTLAHSQMEDWDLVRGLPKKTHPAFPDLAPTILNLRARALHSDFKGLEDVKCALEYLLYDPEVEARKEQHRKVQQDFFAWADECISDMLFEKRPGNADSYKYAVNQLKYFAPKLDFDDITPELLQRFKKYQLSKNKKNTARAYLAAHRSIYNMAVAVGRCRDNKPFAGLFKDIATRKRRQKHRYLPAGEFDRFKALEFSQMGLQRAVDLSMLQFYLAGLDLVDVYFLEWNDIVNGRVILTRSKLGDRAYEFDVKLTEEAERLLKKYAAGEGKDVFPWRKTHTAYDTFYRRHLSHLEAVQERAGLSLAPKNDKLTTKVLRHTFATFGKFAGVGEDVLRELMGHERNDIDTVYKDKYPEEVRDAAHLRIIGDRVEPVEKRKATARPVVRKSLLKSRRD